MRTLVSFQIEGTTGKKCVGNAQTKATFFQYDRWFTKHAAHTTATMALSYGLTVSDYRAKVAARGEISRSEVVMAQDRMSSR
jgi:hypothetical protein